MPDYKEMYLTLIRSQAKAIELLQEAHRQTEEMFISSKEQDLVLLRPDTADDDPAPLH